MNTRTVNIALKSQGGGKFQTVTFKPTLTGASGEVLLEKYYTATTDENGEAAIALPCPATYTVVLPSETGTSEAEFTLLAGSAIDLDEAIALGVETTNTFEAYVDSAIAEFVEVDADGNVTFLGAAGDPNTISILLSEGGTAQIKFLNGDSAPLIIETGDGYLMMPNTDLVIGRDTDANNPNIWIQTNPSGNAKVIQVTNNSTEVFRVSKSGGIKATLSTYANNAAAISGGLSAGDFYKTSSGQVMIVY